MTGSGPSLRCDTDTADDDDGKRVLRLPATRERFAHIAASARREQQAYLGFLAELVIAECEERDRRRIEQRVRAAGLPWRKHLVDFSFEACPTVDASLIGRLSDCAWVRAGSPLCVIGGPGTGKSHLLVGLGIRAAEVGYQVRYAQAASLLTDLGQAAEGGNLAGVARHYGDVDLLLIDDLGHLHLDRRGAELLLAVLNQREQRCAIACAVDRAHFALAAAATDPGPCAAIIERLTAGAHIVETGIRAYSD